MKRKAVIFTQLENFKKSKYPDFLKDILIANGFDTASALKILDNSNIAKIENKVNNKIELLKDTIYVDETGNLIENLFKFLLGHESILLNLPIDVDAYSKSKKKSRQIPAIDKLKELFIERSKNFALKNKIQLTVSPDDLTNFTQTNSRAKCKVNCPICKKTKISCVFELSWKLANFNRHIKLCAEKAATTTQNQQIQRASAEAAQHLLHNVEA